MLDNKTLLYSLLFFLALFMHLIGLNQIGRTWDEPVKVDSGYLAWDRLTAGDFSYESWSEKQEHPMVAKYIYGLFLGPHMIRVDNIHQRFVPPGEVEKLQSGNYIVTGVYDKSYAADYDYTVPRVVSAIFNSLAVVLTVMFAFYLLKGMWAVLAGIFLLLIPRFVVMGQLVTFESLSAFLFCLTAYIFFRFLNEPKNIKLIIGLGVLCGLLFWTRYNNAFIFPFLIGWGFIQYAYTRKKDFIHFQLLIIPTISFFLGVIIWPFLWHRIPYTLFDTLFQQHTERGIGLSLYFMKFLLVTTPIPILLGLTIGIIIAIKRRTYWDSVLLWWFFATIVFFTIFSVATGGTRYVFTVYPALAILAAYGYSIILKKYVLILIPILLFMVWDMFHIHPYYLDYYNQFVGGPGGAVKRDYEFSWWGEGQREVGIWINQHIPPGSSVELFVTPKYVFPPLRRDLKNNGYVDVASESAYVVVSRANRPLLPQEFFKNYKVIYESKVDNEPLVSLFQKI